MIALKKHFPDCQFEGIGGRRMIEQGFVSHFPLDRLAVMGLVEPLKRLPELLGIRRDLAERYRSDPPDIFIGIDAPDFNLNLELSLREKGVVTAHYVSPSVWAWRQGRVKKIARGVDLMLTLFPFEAAFYREHDVKVRCVGHPLADEIPLEDQKLLARERLGLPQDQAYLALLPGSRRSEVEKLTQVFCQAALKCCAVNPDLKILIPAANPARHAQIASLLTSFPDLPVTLSLQNSHDVMAASDVVLMASGTTTLEALLLKRPMVIAYKMAALSYWILSRLVKSKYIGLPNLLADKSLVPELIQDEATPDKLADALNKMLNDPNKSQSLLDEYVAIHTSLKLNASEQAAQAIIDLCGERCAK